MARPGGLEPTTPRFVVWYSIQLSYGRNTACTALLIYALLSHLSIGKWEDLGKIGNFKMNIIYILLFIVRFIVIEFCSIVIVS